MCRGVVDDGRRQNTCGARVKVAAVRSKSLGTTDCLGVSLRRCTRVRAAVAKPTATKSKLISPAAEQRAGYGGAEQSSGAGEASAAHWVAEEV